MESDYSLFQGSSSLPYGEYRAQHKLIVAIAPMVGAAAEVVTYLGGSETYCQQRLGTSDPGWFLDFDVTPPEVGLCACSCARFAELGRLLVIFGCGGGPVGMG